LTTYYNGVIISTVTRR